LLDGLGDLFHQNRFVLPWFQFLFFCEDSPSVGQVGVHESPVTSHFGRGLPRCYLLFKKRETHTRYYATKLSCFGIQ
jgi:hypothetical protein